MTGKDSEIKLSFNRNYHKFMQWDITQHCNLCCAHCRSTEFYSQSKNIDLSLDVNKRIAEELYVNGVRRIHFLGGEPLFRKDFCEFIDYIESIGMEWSVNTNATLLTEEVAKRFLKARARAITVSLDGPDAESNDAIRGQGVFGKVCENTERLTSLRDKQGSDTRVVISCTVLRQNIGHPAAMASLARQLHVNSLILSSLRPMGRAKESVCDLGVDPVTELDFGEEVVNNFTKGNTQHVQLGFLTPVAIQYLNEKYGTAFPLYDSSCNAIVQKGYIQPDGALFPCQSLTDSAETPAIIGTVSRRSLANHRFDEIWNSKEMRRIEAALFSPKIGKLMLPCRYCRYFRVLCYPCPLGELGGRRSIHYTCLEAMTKMAERQGYDPPWHDLISNIGNASENQKEVKKS